MTPLNGSPRAGTGKQLPWWARASGINLYFVLPLLLLVVWGGATGFRGLTIRAEHYLSTPYVLLCVALVVVSAFGARLGEQLQLRAVMHSRSDHLRAATIGLAICLLLVYAFWFRVFLVRPDLLLDILSGAAKPDRDVIGTVVGVTTLVNLAPVFFALAGYLLLIEGDRNRLLWALLAVLVALTLFRAYVWSERLALAEAAIPLALAWVTRQNPTRRVTRAAWMLGPYLAVPLVFLFFALTEFFRAWQYYSDTMSFWEFAFGRFVSYYYTSLNNGAGMLSTADWPDGSVQHVLLWLHRFPFGIGNTFSDAVGVSDQSMDDPGTAAGRLFLRVYGDPEFNLPSSFLSVTFDLGIAGALIYFFVSMLLSGVLYARYVRRDLVGVLLYPSVLVTLFETFRYPYWGSSRAVLWLAGSLLVILLLWACRALHQVRVGRSLAEPSPVPG